MRESEGDSPGRQLAAADGSAAVVIDGLGTVLLCTPAAAALLDCAPGTPCAPMVGLLPAPGADPAPRPPVRTTVHDAAGRPLELACTVAPLTAGSAAEPGGPGHWLVLLAPVTPGPAEPPAEGPTGAVGPDRRTSHGTRRDGDNRRATLSHAAAGSIGASLDMVDTAETLVDLLVPAFADLAAVDLAETVLQGDEPPLLTAGGGVRLRRVAAARGAEVSAEHLPPVGDLLPPTADNPLLRPLLDGRPVLVGDLDRLRASGGLAPEELRVFAPEGALSFVAVPLFARGLVLGCLTLWRGREPSAFDEEDATVLAEVASRAALSVDNARRYTKERRVAVALQRSLLPHSVSRLAAAETVGMYQPAGGGAGVGGDWFDVIPLPSLRVAFVVGDVVGHGLGATAAMARLRTAVQTLADLDLEPGELLTHLDDLVLGFSSEQDARTYRAEPAVLGATCLYAVYDPVAGRCAVATAGHPAPVVAAPGAPAVPLDLVPGPPLGVGGMPFEVAEFEVAPQTVLALFTDGLVRSRDGDLGDIDEGTDRLCRALGDTTRPGLPLDEVTRTVFDRLLPAVPTDDVALLLARTHELPPDHVAEWQLEADLAVVGRARELVVGQLAAWHLEHLGFVTELVVSELVTNAIRYAGGPVGLRLIRDRVLVCEVSDPSSTQPRLRRARDTDEGGRGLFLVAQLADRWGSRFTRSGKTIWTEQAVAGG
ncbi:SpoIIE family protein phosphatase [Kitasatospora sp. NPDC094015]|uniref:SpoIIE family protein phosphatase n=1 Tax=Kitasatospora sp. NPDC094015 TaxID=3155205 RepID=UPI0033197AF6